MKKIIASSVLATASLFPILAQAESLPATMSVDQTVEIRKGATISYPIISTLPTGKSVTIIDEFTNSTGEKWYRVDLGASKGWGPASNFSSEESDTLKNGDKAIITENNVNVRKGATTSYAAVAKLPKNTVVAILDSFTNTAGEQWYRIESGALKGWVISDYIKQQTEVSPPPPSTETKTIAAASAPVRKGATASYDIVATVSKNQKVTIIDTFKNSSGEQWYRIDLGSVKGWIHQSAFSADTPPPPTEDVKLPQIGSYVYSSQNGVDVRKGATDSYPSVSKLSLNQKIKVVDHFVPAGGKPWLRVQVTSSLLGWVPADSVSETEGINKQLYISVDVANLRSGPSLSHAVVDQAKKGVSFTATAQEKDSKGDIWYRLSTSSNSVVWAHESVVSEKEAVKPIGSTQYIGTKNAAVYAGATFQYKIKERPAYNTKVSVLSEFVNANGEQWIQIKTPRGTTGWIPRYELVASQADHEYLYAKKGAVIRKGASAKYAVSAYLRESESLKILQRLNGWVNAENSAGVRGWVLESQTTTVSPNRLTAPSVLASGNNTIIEWVKAGSLNIKYDTLSSNRLKITGGISDVELPAGAIKGIERIDKISSGLVVTFKPGYSFTLRDYSNTLSLKVVPYGLLGKKVIIDAGHGGKDTGAIGPTGLREKDVNLSTALLLKAELEQYGAQVTLTRSTDIFLELAERTAIANASDADTFISIHADSFSSTSRGSTTFYNSTVSFNGPRSKTLGDSIQKNMISSLNTYNRGVKEQNFYVNRMNHLPSVLVELAFLSNPREEKLLKSTEFRKKAAVGITKGLEEYFNKF